MKEITVNCGCGEKHCRVYFTIQRDGPEYMAYIDGGDETADIFFTKKELLDLRNKIDLLLGDKNED